jgi:NADH dehydrogenase FAD-containing subunit
VSPRVLPVGAGHAHIEVPRQAAALPERAARYVLLTDRQPTFYSGMLPGLVAGHYSVSDLAIDAVALAKRANAELILERALRVDAAARRVLTDSGRAIEFDFARRGCAARARARSRSRCSIAPARCWPAPRRSSRGFVRVRPTLQVEGCDRLFAAGDCASLAGMKKAGVYAVRSAPVLASNLRRALAGRELRAHRPQREFLSLLNLGDGIAIGVKRGVSFEGRWALRLEHGIDRRFVERYR